MVLAELRRLEPKQHYKYRQQDCYCDVTLCDRPTDPHCTALNGALLLPFPLLYRVAKHLNLFGFRQSFKFYYCRCVKTIVAKLILFTQNNQKYWEKSKRSCHSLESTVYIVSYLCYTYQYGFSNKILAYPVANKYNQSKIKINYEYLCLQGLWARERPRLSTTASFAPRAAGHPPPWYFWDSYDLCWCRRNPRAYSCFAHCTL